MEKNTPKTDRRTRRTRQALYHGLIQLLEEKPVAEISVKELCQVCDLNRSTFYLHYASVQELLEAMEQEILEGLNEVLDKFDAAFMQSPDPVPRDAALAEAFQFLSDRSEFCQVILSRRSDPDFIDQVKAVVRSRCLNQWAQLLDRGGARTPGRNISSPLCCRAAWGWWSSGWRMACASPPPSWPIWSTALSLPGLPISSRGPINRHSHKKPPLRSAKAVFVYAGRKFYFSSTAPVLALVTSRAYRASQPDTAGRTGGTKVLRRASSSSSDTFRWME